jgi:hypothetical protein
VAGGNTIKDNVCYNGPRAGINFNDGFMGDNLVQVIPRMDWLLSRPLTRAYTNTPLPLSLSPHYHYFPIAARLYMQLFSPNSNHYHHHHHHQQCASSCNPSPISAFLPPLYTTPHTHSLCDSTLLFVGFPSTPSMVRYGTDYNTVGELDLQHGS